MDEVCFVPAEHHSSTGPDNLDRKSESSELPSPRALVRPEDLEPLNPGSSLRKTVRTIRRPQAAPDHFLTMASVIGATSDGPLTSSKEGDKTGLIFYYLTRPTKNLIHKSDQ